MGSALRIKQKHKVPRQPGERARLKVMRGPDYGVVFIVVGPRATVGRGEDNDLVLTDLKASRVHAEILETPQGWMVKDRNSVNGILHNGKSAQQGFLQNGHTLTLGESTLEFFASGSSDTRELVALPRALDFVKSAQELKQKGLQPYPGPAAVVGGGGVSLPSSLGIASGSLSPPPSVGLNRLFSRSSSSRAEAGFQADLVRGKQAKKLSPLSVVLGIVVVGLIILPNLQPGKVGLGGSKAGSRQKQALDGKKMPAGTSGEADAGQGSQGQDDAPQVDLSRNNYEKNRVAETFFKQGFREYLNGNFLRARIQFETVLQVAPGHKLARIYLENCQTSVIAEIKNCKTLAAHAFQSGKLKEAKLNFKRILRLLNRERGHPDYREAKSQCEAVERAMEQKTRDCEGDLS